MKSFSIFDVHMFKGLFALSLLIPLAGFAENQSSITHLVRLPIFCDVAGHYQGTHTEGTWTATIDPYTGIVNLHIDTNGNHIFGTGSIRQIEKRTVFLFNAPEGTAWRGVFSTDQTGITLSGHTLSFDTEGKFQALRNQPPSSCRTEVSPSSIN